MVDPEQEQEKPCRSNQTVSSRENTQLHIKPVNKREKKHLFYQDIYKYKNIFISTIWPKELKS